MQIVQIYFKNLNKLAGITNFPSWIRIRILDEDPDSGEKMNADPCKSGSTPL